MLRTWLWCSGRSDQAIGALWTAMTVSFEFGLGRFVAGRSWARLVGDYDVGGGRLWCLVILTILMVPPLFHLATRPRQADEQTLR